MKFSRRLNLEKFYLDVVCADGSGCIGYATRLDAGVLLEPAALLTWDADGNASPAQVRTWRGATPGRNGDTWSWHCPALAASGMWQGDDRIVSECLWESANGGVWWENLATRAKATMRIGDRTLVGWGYIERLRLTVAPWRLPIDGLRWGRLVTPETSVVWIRWEHATGRSWLWHDGRRREARCITEQFIEWPEGRIVFDTHRRLRHGRLGDTVFARWPQARRLLPARVRAYEETKWCSRATLSLDGRADGSGWAIHEFVRFQ